MIFSEQIKTIEQISSEWKTQVLGGNITITSIGKPDLWGDRTVFFFIGGRVLAKADYYCSISPERFHYVIKTQYLQIPLTDEEEIKQFNDILGGYVKAYEQEQEQEQEQ